MYIHLLSLWACDEQGSAPGSLPTSRMILKPRQIFEGRQNQGSSSLVYVIRAGFCFTAFPGRHQIDSSMYLYLKLTAFFGCTLVSYTVLGTLTNIKRNDVPFG